MAQIDANFSKLVSEEYVQAHFHGDISKYSHTAPYNFAFLYDFWKPDFYEALSETQHSLKTSYKPDELDSIDIFYEPFDMDLFLRVVYGETFRSFLSSLVGLSTFIRPKECYPQLRATKSSSSGLSIHTDETAPYNGVVFFHLNDKWIKGDGGEFIIWEKLSDRHFKKAHEYAPLGNSLSVLLLGKNSHHSVNKSNGDWIRKSIMMEVQFE